MTMRPPPSRLPELSVVRKEAFEPNEAVLEAQDLSKSYGGRNVLRNVSCSFGAGIHAIRGPNGSGKSTLLRILGGVQPPDSGDVSLCGRSLRRDPVGYKSLCAFVPDEPWSFPFLTGRDFVSFISSVRRMAPSDFEGCIEAFGLSRYVDTQFGRMSLGTQRKFLMAVAFGSKPILLLMDEPTTTLDAESLQQLARLMRSRSALATIFSTHDVGFVDEVRAEVRRIDSGELWSAD